MSNVNSQRYRFYNLAQQLETQLERLVSPEYLNRLALLGSGRHFEVYRLEADFKDLVLCISRRRLDEAYVYEWYNYLEILEKKGASMFPPMLRSFLGGRALILRPYAERVFLARELESSYSHLLEGFSKLLSSQSLEIVDDLQLGWFWGAPWVIDFSDLIHQGGRLD